MLSTEERSRLTVVLVGARNPQNIGAAARAMQDFGFSNLRIVNEYGAPFEAAQLEASSAVGLAAEVMRTATRFSSLPEAIEDCTLVAGTTAIGERGLRQAVLPLRDVAPKLLRELQRRPPETPPTGNNDLLAGAARVALLFGSEKTGLTREQLSYCEALLTIPMYAPGGRHLSMNLGQAVAVCLYELSREGFEGARVLPTLAEERATSADRERLLALVLQAMEASGYAHRFPANARPEIVRQLVGRLGESSAEATTWMGLFRLMRRAMPTVPARPDETLE